MSRTQTAGNKPGSVSRALARDRLGVPNVLFFVLAGVAPLTVAAGVIPTAYATTGLTGIPAAFVVIAVILGLFATGYVAMTRHITNAGAFYAFIARGLGRSTGVAAALVALLSYTFLQVGLYGAFGPNAASEAAAHLHLHAPWWAWALGAWAVITVLGLLRVDITGAVLGVLLCAEILVIVAETVSGLAHPAGGHLSFATLSPAALTSAGFGTFGVLAVVAVLGFVGFEQAPVMAEEARNPRRTIPVATYLALGMIAVVYAGASWAMAARAGTSHVVAIAGKQGPGLLFSLGGGGLLSQAAQWLFLTSLFAAALAFHNACWRYIYALGRENVLPAALGRTGGNNIPKAASLAQSATGLVVIVMYALAGWDPMEKLFFWLGTTGGFGILVLLAVTSVAVVSFFARDHRGENTWRRLIAPALATVLLGGIVALAVRNYATLLGVPPGDAAAWALPASYAAVAVTGSGGAWC
ncbi:MAG: APC family permease [Streptosporangiaceae bacterium]